MPDFSHLTSHGWVLTNEAEMGFRREPILEAARPLLAPSVVAGKSNCRDVLAYDRVAASLRILPAASNWHYGLNGLILRGVPRFDFLAAGGEGIARALLDLIPQGSRLMSGEVAADVFETTSGVAVDEHADKHASFVMLYVLDRAPEAREGANYLKTRERGDTVFSQVLEPGEILIFNDELFTHGVGPLQGSHRDVLVCTVMSAEYLEKKASADHQLAARQ